MFVDLSGLVSMTLLFISKGIDSLEIIENIIPPYNLSKNKIKLHCRVTKASMLPI